MGVNDIPNNRRTHSGMSLLMLKLRRSVDVRYMQNMLNGERRR